MTTSETPSGLERYSAIAFGGLLLIIAASLFGWGIRLVFAGLFSAAGWPPGLAQLLLPINVTALVVGFGSWRLLAMGLPKRVFGLSLGWAVLATFGLAAIVGAVA